MDHAGPTGRAGRRQCPLCGRSADADHCPTDGMATLRVGAPPSDPGRVQVGARIAGRYRVEGLLGKGGFGTVFAATHTGTGQKVALKVLAGSIHDQEVALRRFFLEARVTASLQHPNTVRVFDFGQEDSGLVYIAMELLSGLTLRAALAERLQAGRVFDEREAVEIASGVLRSLGEAHAAGLVHRDLKPENIFLHEVRGGERVTKVLDFGIVKMLGGATLTGASSIIGTPAYMSPEQARSAPLDARSDIYSLGVILFQLVSGALPFAAETPVQMLLQHIGAAPPDLASRAPVSLSERFVAAVARALAKDPAARFPDAASFRSALTGEAPAPAPLASVTEEVSMSRRPEEAAPRPRSPRRLVVAGSLLLVGAAAAAWWAVSSGPASNTEAARSAKPEGPSAKTDLATAPPEKAEAPHEKAEAPHEKAEAPHEKAEAPHEKAEAPHEKAEAPSARPEAPPAKPEAPRAKGGAARPKPRANATGARPKTDPTRPPPAPTTPPPAPETPLPRESNPFEGR